MKAYTYFIAEPGFRPLEERAIPIMDQEVVPAFFRVIEHFTGLDSTMAQIIMHRGEKITHPKFTFWAEERCPHPSAHDLDCQKGWPVAKTCTCRRPDLARGTAVTRAAANKKEPPNA